MSVAVDLKSGNAGRLGPEGYEFDRIARVTGVAGYSDDGRKAYAAMVALANQIPPIVIGSPHPSVSTARLRDISWSIVDPNTVRLDLHYVDADENPQIELSSGAMDVEVNRGYFVEESAPGRVSSRDDMLSDMYVEHTYPDDWPVEQYRGRTLKTGVTASILVPRPTITIRRREYDQTYVHYVDLIATHVGTINNPTWEIDPKGGPRSWLCVDIAPRCVEHRRRHDVWLNPDAPKSWEVTYSFQYAPTYEPYDGYDKRFVFLDPETGRPIDPDETDDDGINVEVRRYQVYQESDFNALGLTAPQGGRVLGAPRIPKS